MLFIRLVPTEQYEYINTEDVNKKNYASHKQLNKRYTSHLYRIYRAIAQIEYRHLQM